MDDNNHSDADHGVWSSLAGFCLSRRLITLLVFGLLMLLAVMVAPFDWNTGIIPRYPVPVDAIPDIGENQQIVFTEWMGRSPRDVEDQISYPLTVSLLGVPGVRTVRSMSMFGFSSVYVIFKDDVDFYWSRSRILEKLSSLPAGLLPEGVNPRLGPDATGLGQVFWYTLEGCDANGKPAGSWGLEELRSIQDWVLRYALLSVDGVSEVASIGGYVKEYQIDADPDAMRAFGVGMGELVDAVRRSNLDVGARTVEINQIEYIIRGLGYVKNIDDLGEAVVKVNGHTPVRVRDVARLSLGPALRNGLLEKGGRETVGGVVTMRFGENPLRVIDGVKRKLAELAPSLPRRTGADGVVSQVRVKPFYDRSGLIHETLGTLSKALIEEIMITVIVIMVMFRRFRMAMLVCGVLPASVLGAFLLMKAFGVDANIVALSGIAIAIGTSVDMGIVICENIVGRLDAAPVLEPRIKVIRKAVGEVGGAVATSVSTTLIGFVPVFSLQYAEGKLFRPLAFTNTFTLLAALMLALTVMPVLASFLLSLQPRGRWGDVGGVLLLIGGVVIVTMMPLAGSLLLFIGIVSLTHGRLPESWRPWFMNGAYAAGVLFLLVLLALHWLPLGPASGRMANVVAVAIPIVVLLGGYAGFQHYYAGILDFCLRHYLCFLCLPVLLLLFGALAWFGAGKLTRHLPEKLRHGGLAASFERLFPGMGHEFMPALDEGAFLFMPTLMPHAGMGAVSEVLRRQGAAISAIPEVEIAVGKAGRADSPLDPAPLTMIETVVNYKSEYLLNADGSPGRFRYDPMAVDLFRDAEGKALPAPDGKPYKVRGTFVRDSGGQLIPDGNGMVFRQWRRGLEAGLNPGRVEWPGIRRPSDIWDEVALAAELPGVTSAPRLQPIETRLVMLQSGMRAPMGVKIQGKSQEDIEKASLVLENVLRRCPAVIPSTVVADRTLGKPYLEIVIDRPAIARYGIKLEAVQELIEVAVGGKKLMDTVEGRERYPVRVRYPRDSRDSVEALGAILVPAPDGAQIPLRELAAIKYSRGPQVIKSEDGFLTGYVFFGGKPGVADGVTVREASAYLGDMSGRGELELPVGVGYRFAGSYENQERASRHLAFIIPLSLSLIFIVLMLQFRSVAVSLLIFSGVAVAWAGGFVMLWLYGQDWFMDFGGLRGLLNIGTVNLSVAVWVGFLALFGIATDDGVVMASYISDSISGKRLRSVEALRHTILTAGLRRVRPCLMTTATTVLALLPVLSSTGRGADLMIPMAIPVFGGMLFEILTMLVVPVLYYMLEARKLGTVKNQSAL